MVGPVPVGVNTFTFSAPPPEPHKIPHDDVLGVAAIILTASYKDQEFVRVGYYQNTEYDDPAMMEAIREGGVKGDIQWNRLVRNLADKPRVTRFSIKWYVRHAFFQFFSYFLFHFPFVGMMERHVASCRLSSHPVSPSFFREVAISPKVTTHSLLLCL